VGLLGVVAASGCGGIGKLHPVSGKITGVNKIEGTVNFLPEKKFAKPLDIRGEIKDGSYTMKTDGKDGVPEGKYTVSIAPKPAAPGGMDPSAMTGAGEKPPPPTAASVVVEKPVTVTNPTVTVPSGNYDLAVTR